MFTILAKYLHQYKQLHVPGIGNFEVVEQPARLEYADRLIYPPVFEIRHSEGGVLNQTQIEYLKEELEADQYIVEKKLEQFGQSLKQKLGDTPFNWPGLGTLNLRQNRLQFQTASIGNLSPVGAHKVIRENAQHTVDQSVAHAD